MKRVIAILLLLVALLGTTQRLHAQVWQDWVQFCSPPGSISTGLNSIAVDNEGNIIVAGLNYTWSSTADIILIKYNPNSTVIWRAIWTSIPGYFNTVHALKIDEENNIYLVGSTECTPTGYAGMLTVKYRSSGQQEWARIFDFADSGRCTGSDLAIDAFGNVLVTGSGGRPGWWLPSNIVTIKYNSDGGQQWAAIYDGPPNNHDEAIAITTDLFGNVYVAGAAFRPSSTLDYATIKYDSSGVQQWVAFYGWIPTLADIPCAIIADAQANIYVTGYTGSSHTGTDFLTIKYNASGQVLWRAEYNRSGVSTDYPRGMVLDTMGNVLITGYTVGAGNEGDWATVKYNPEGTLIWETFYDGPGRGNDSPQALAVDVDGNVYVTGGSDREWGEGIHNDCTSLKYDSNGFLTWSIRYEGTDDSGAAGIVLANPVDIYICGGHDNMDMTLKYSQLPPEVMTSQNNVSSIIPALSPNPFNFAATFSYMLPEASHISLEVCDITGKLVTTLVKGWQQAGSHQVTFNGANHPSGIYLYRLNAGQFTASGKMVLLK